MRDKFETKFREKTVNENLESCESCWLDSQISQFSNEERAKPWIKPLLFFTSKVKGDI